MFVIKEVGMQHNNGTSASVRYATNSTLWEGLSKDNTQECEGGSTLHGRSVDKAGASTSARGLDGSTG